MLRWKSLLMGLLLLNLTTLTATNQTPNLRPFRQNKIYLANPMGFSAQQQALLLPEIVTKLESLGLEVVEPFSQNTTLDISTPTWAYEVGQRCINDVRNCDAIFAVINGTPPDEGVMIELGLAIAMGKEVFIFRDDFRRCTDSEMYPVNLMIFAGLSEENWKESYFTSVEEITSPNKKLNQWSNSVLQLSQ
ncbi:MAG: hypothetical protein KR126chlam2_01133 [Chlamydiae bacterium]|nr:hypothetical protein [Chlamydiota bacterium]